jgi:hypothetical protein
MNCKRCRGNRFLQLTKYVFRQVEVPPSYDTIRPNKRCSSGRNSDKLVKARGLLCDYVNPNKNGVDLHCAIEVKFIGSRLPLVAVTNQDPVLSEEVKA